MIDKIITKVGAKTFAAIAAALSAAIFAIIAAIKIYFATRRAYNKGRKDEREDWRKQEKIWKERVAAVKKSNRSLWDKLKEIERLRKEFEAYKRRNK